MANADLIAMLAAIFSAISAFSALIACVLSVQQNRPLFKFELKENECIFASELDKHFAIIAFEIQNRSAVSGMVSDIYISYSGNNYHGETSSSLYEISPLKVQVTDAQQKYQKDFEKSRYKLPIVINGFSVVSGFIFVPNFPIINADSFTFPVGIHFVNRKFDNIVSFRFINRKGISLDELNKAYDQTTNTN